MVIPGHNLGNSQVSVNRTIGPTLVIIDHYCAGVSNKPCLLPSFINSVFVAFAISL